MSQEVGAVFWTGYSAIEFRGEMILTKFQYRICVVIAFVAVILSVPLSLVLPVEASFENGLIENAQVVILFVSVIFLLKVRLPLKWFRRFFAAVFLLIALRELSWGCVFFPLKMKPLGPIFIAMTDYEYRIPVYTFLVVYMSAMIFMLIRFVPVRKLIKSRQPIAVFAVMMLPLIFSFVGEHGWFIGKACGQILEEFNELILYATLPAMVLYYCGYCQKKFPV